MKAYTFIQDNKVMISKLPKPYKPTRTEGYGKIWDVTDCYHRLELEWQSSILGEVDNVQLKLGIWMIPGDSEYIKDWTPIKPNQPCEVEKSGKKYIITSI